MVKLFLIRHAESEANRLDLLAGQLDYPLTEKGKNDIALIAQQFHSEHTIDMIVSSPLKRAVQTAEAFASLYALPVQTDKRLIEQDIGIFQGKSYAELGNDKEYEHDRTKRWNWVPRNGESYKMMADRLRSLFEMSIRNHQDKKVLIVTHAVTLRIIRGLLENTLPAYPSEIAKNGEVWITSLSEVGKAHTIEIFNISERLTKASKE
jgi:broad specificity phosphatase PhoE